MDFTPSLNAKGFFRFTGPPENWLTAIKFMTWGLEEKHRNRWAEIQPGDVFFIHSTGPSTSLFNNAKSGIIGIGVVGSNFSEKNNYLWVREFREKRNIWPLLVPFSEIYLFSELPPRESWDAPSEVNISKTRKLIEVLLKNYISLSNIKGFPQMGSFSSVSKEVSQQILYDKRPLFVYSNNQIIDNIIISKPTKLEKIKSASEALRYAGTLQVFENIKTRVVKEAPGQYMRDNELLARAETVHSTILENLIHIFRSKGYETRSNRFVDLFAYNENRSFLFEVKSTENKNFRRQARDGLIKLFEYDYFDIRKFIAENSFVFKDKYKILALSKIPEDTGYVGFINYLKTGVAVVGNKSLKAVGSDFGFTKL
jgi:hypothetical protein